MCSTVSPLFVKGSHWQLSATDSVVLVSVEHCITSNYVISGN